jgi:hypothetical protein
VLPFVFMLLTTIALTLLVAKPDAGIADRPLEYDRPIVQADLEGRTLRELALMRNTIFARAGQVFRKRWLAMWFTQYDWYKPSGFDKKLVTKLGRENAARIAEYELKLPRAELSKRLDALIAGGEKAMIAGGYEKLLEARLLAVATGRELPWELRPDEDEADRRDPLYDLELLNEPLSVSDLSDYSRRDLRILRNTVFARRGRPFKTESMRHYFVRMSWYRPDPKYTDKRLTQVDLENIKLIRSVEETQGGPQTEEEAKAEHGGLEDFSGA